MAPIRIERFSRSKATKANGNGKVTLSTNGKAKAKTNGHTNGHVVNGTKA
jgi:hypothetical protein